MKRKVVLVTGASSGIGQSICKHLISKEYIVYGTSRKGSEPTAHADYPLLTLDLQSKESIQAAISEILSKEGRIDVLVNNAGMGMAGAIEDSSREEIRDFFDINVIGLIECSKAVIPAMRAQNQGLIINISSIAGEFGLPFRGIYSASKSAIDRISETMRMELSSWNIAVSIVQPGDFRTNINNNRKIAANSLRETSAYYTNFKKQYAQISRDVAAAQDPVAVAQIVEKIIRSKSPNMRYPAATFVQRLSISINRILPTHWFQQMLVRMYPLK